MRLERHARVFALGIALASPASAIAQSNSDPVLERLQALEQEVAVLRRQLEVKAEAEAARTADAPRISGGRDGFSIQSADRAYQLRLRGYAQADSRLFATPDEGSSDTFSLRRVRLQFEGTVGEKVDFRIMPDFAQGTVALFDAYVNLRLRPALNLQVGKFKPPLGLERLQSATAISFVERAFPTLFVPSRDIGVQLGGEVLGGRLTYQFGAFNGVRDGGTGVGSGEGGDADTNDGKEVSARLFAQPFVESGFAALRGLGFGFAASVGRTSQTLASYRNSGFANFFQYRSGATGKGGRVRIVPQAYWYWGSFGVLGEYVRSSQNVALGAQQERFDNEAWQLALSWVVTGENASFRGVVPRSEFGRGGFGALELAARVNGVNFDDELFPTFADPAAFIDTAVGYTLGINWYLNRNVKLSVDYDHVKYRGGRPLGRNRKSEDQLLTRVQLQY